MSDLRSENRNRLCKNCLFNNARTVWLMTEKFCFHENEISTGSLFHRQQIQFEPRHEKTCLCHMRKTKEQISCASAQSDQRLSCSLPRYIYNSIISLVSIFAIS